MKKQELIELVDQLEEREVVLERVCYELFSTMASLLDDPIISMRVDDNIHFMMNTLVEIAEIRKNVVDLVDIKYEFDEV